MMRAEDVARAVLLCATLPPRTVIEEIVMSPTIARDWSVDVAVAAAKGDRECGEELVHDHRWWARDAVGEAEGAALAKQAEASGRPVAVDLDERAAYRYQRRRAAKALASLEAPDFTLPDLDGRPHSLSAQRGESSAGRLCVAGGCRLDLPVWQGVYESCRGSASR
jgi:hypothetical protein